MDSVPGNTIGPVQRNGRQNTTSQEKNTFDLRFESKHSCRKIPTRASHAHFAKQIRIKGYQTFREPKKHSGSNVSVQSAFTLKHGLHEEQLVMMLLGHRLDAQSTNNRQLVGENCLETVSNGEASSGSS